MKKGFTLIELLAVIVILAIIVVITVPIIGNVIQESKKQALEASIRGLIEATDYFAVYNDGVYEFQFNENNKGVTPGGDSLDYNGSVDAEGKLVLDNDGNISLCLMNDNYYAYKNYNSGIVVEKRNGDSCSVEYDALTNKYIAFLESEGSVSNVYSKDEVDNLIDNVNTNITTNTNEITNVKTSIETLQTSLNDYALKSELETTNTNLNNVSQIVTSNQSSITDLQNDLASLTTGVSNNTNRINNSYMYRRTSPTIVTSQSTTSSTLDVTLPVDASMYLFFISYQNTPYQTVSNMGVYLVGYTSNYGVNSKAITTFAPLSSVSVVDSSTNKIRFTFSSASYYRVNYMLLY